MYWTVQHLDNSSVLTLIQSCLHLTSNQQQHEKQTAYVVTNAIVVSS